jgi:serine/threonine-protein kinase RsbW
MPLLTLASDRDNIRQVEPFLRSIDGLSVLPQDRYHNMLVAVTEAVNNAIIHGNGADPHKTATLHVTMTPEQAVFVITDEGPGFDADAIPDPRLPENLLREGGRGVFLIRQLSDDVSFSNTDHGSSVTITFGFS